MITFAGRPLNVPSNTLMKGGVKNPLTQTDTVARPVEPPLNENYSAEMAQRQGRVAEGPRRTENPLTPTETVARPGGTFTSSNYFADRLDQSNPPQTDDTIVNERLERINEAQEQSLIDPVESVQKMYADKKVYGVTQRMLDQGRREGFIKTQENIDKIRNPKKSFLTKLKDQIIDPFAQTAENIDRLEKKGLLAILPGQVAVKESSEDKSQENTKEIPTTSAVPVSSRPVSKEELKEYNRLLKGNKNDKILNGKTFLSAITFTWVFNWIGLETVAYIWYYLWYYFFKFIWLIIIFGLLIALWSVCQVVWELIGIGIKISKQVVGGLSKTLQDAVNKAIIPGLKIDAKIFKFRTPDIKLLGFLQGTANSVKRSYNDIPNSQLEVVLKILIASIKKIFNNI